MLIFRSLQYPSKNQLSVETPCLRCWIASEHPRRGANMSRIIAAGFLLGVLTTATFAQTASSKKPVEAKKPQAAKPRFKITISKETTYLTRPLTKDGYIDYERALNEQTSKGVTPENNAAVLIWKAYGPQEIGKYGSREFQKAFRKRFFKMLKIEPLPEKGDYILPLSEYAGKIGGADVPKPGTPEQKEWENELTERFKNLYQQPWSRKEHPLIARWLDAHEEQFKTLTIASRRPQMYSPMIYSTEAAYGMLVAASVRTAWQFRESAFMLSARAMLRLYEGKTEDAHQDIQTCHRLARLEGQASTLLHVLVADNIETFACRGDAMIAAHGNLTVQQAARFQADLRKLTSMPRAIDKLNTAERYTYLDLVIMIMHLGPKAWNDFFHRQ